MHNKDDNDVIFIKQETKEMKICIVCHRQVPTKKYTNNAAHSLSRRRTNFLKDIANLYRDNFYGKTIQ